MQWLDLGAWRAHGWDRQGGTAALEIRFDPERLELTMAGGSILPKLPLFNAIDGDLTGQTTSVPRPPGPLLDAEAVKRNVDPRLPAAKAAP